MGEGRKESDRFLQFCFWESEAVLHVSERIPNAISKVDRLLGLQLLPSLLQALNFFVNVDQFIAHTHSPLFFDLNYQNCYSLSK